MFTSQDAMTRLATQEFLEVDNSESNYVPESEIEEKFEKIRPKLLGCIFNILSRAIRIRENIRGKYSLGRMADVLEWGEAISQTMGYKEGEFLNIFKLLTSIQQKYAAKSDPLIVAYMKLFYEIFEDEIKKFSSERIVGYKVFDYNSLQDKLTRIAEIEGYNHRQKQYLAKE